MMYYLFITFLCAVLLFMSYFIPNEFLLEKLPRLTANIGIGVLRVTMLVKPVFMIMMRYFARQRSGIVKYLFNIFYAISKRGMEYRRQL